MKQRNHELLGPVVGIVKKEAGDHRTELFPNAHSFRTIFNMFGPSIVSLHIVEYVPVDTPHGQESLLRVVKPGVTRSEAEGHLIQRWSEDNG